MGIEGLDQVPSPPALDDLYDGLADEVPPPAVSRQVRWGPGVISLALSVYGFWVGFAALRAWFSPGPFCAAECRRGILYAVLLLIPACFGVILGLALIKGRPWAPPAALAVFGAFALENLVRIDPEFRFTYRLVFLVMFIANLAGIATLIWGGPKWNPLAEQTGGLNGSRLIERTVDGGVTLASGRVVHPDQMGLSVQESAPGEGQTKARLAGASCRIVAATLLIAATAWYRLPDALLRKDFLGVFSFERPPVPHWLAASPAVSALVLLAFACATGLLMAKRWARIVTNVTAAIIAAMCISYLPLAPNWSVRVECIGLSVLNGLLAALLLIPKCRSAGHE
ncbi:MAG: hypothetical protein DCC49_05420 [Acidobacteria bacterium]|nr:MAG: hypothetical protein DCC49_05420 [Acidobacteriota bacterium]